MNLPLNYQKLGALLAEHRKSTGWRQIDVGRKFGYENPQYVSNIERGLCPPSPKLLKQMIKLYGLNPVEQEELSYALKTEFSQKLRVIVGI